MRVLIIEDEIPAQRLINDLLQGIDPEIEILGCLNSVKSAVAWFKENVHPDIVLLDIQLSDGLSFAIFKEVQVDSMIVFTTAYDEYAMQAFKVNSLDYLLKPVEKEELQSALEKYAQYSKQFIQKKNTTTDFDEVATFLMNERREYRKRFLIQSNEAFFYTTQRITFAVTFEKREYPVNFALETLKEQLDQDMFFKISRQYIVNIKAIKKVHTYFQRKLKIETNPPHSEDIIVGKDKAASFKKWLDR